MRHNEMDMSQLGEYAAHSLFFGKLESESRSGRGRDMSMFSKGR